MKDFNFLNRTEIIFGKEALSNLQGKIKENGSKVLLHYGSGHIKKNGLYEKIISELNENKIEFIELSGVEPNPRLSLIREGIDLCKKENVDFILAVGGGSVIDSAKGIAMGVKNEDDVWSYYETGKPIDSALNIGVILTIPAAGSESSTNSVVTSEIGGYKLGYGSRHLVPKFALLNPELTYTLPNYQMACGIVDMMAHVFERYFTNEKNVDVSDRLCEGLLKSIIENANIAIKEPKNYNAKAELMWAGTLAHNGLIGMGRSEDWSSHGIEHELSAIYDITHGAGLAIIFPAWMKYVYKNNIKKFVQFANRVWNVDINFDNMEETAILGIEKCESFFENLGIPTKLDKLKIDEENFETMAKKFNKKGRRGEFVSLVFEDVIEIYKLASKS